MGNNGRSNSNNNKYTRDDYMHAASQCLAVEAEMAKVIEEHPEILQELKDETNQMNQQKELLEKELLDAQEKLSSMKKEKKKKEKKEYDEEGAFIIPKNNKNSSSVDQGENNNSSIKEQQQQQQQQQDSSETNKEDQ